MYFFYYVSNSEIDCVLMLMLSVAVRSPNPPDVSAIQSSTFSVTHIDETRATTKFLESTINTTIAGARSMDSDSSSRSPANLQCDALANCKVHNSFFVIRRAQFCCSIESTTPCLLYWICNFLFAIQRAQLFVFYAEYATSSLLYREHNSLSSMLNMQPLVCYTESTTPCL